ncbi:MAG: hypothetical protein J2P37_11585 [Ktedonobacteraceae bacterium]|nr:hypothetical protein [Ktedonobacteraceae bacterium]MBO0793947.1 hypothetical protein [Ktedonobacteraceae bacterium]
MVQAIIRVCRAALDRLAETGCYTRFNFGEASVGYYCDEAETLTWLRRFFAGYFASSMLASTHAWIYTTQDADLLATLQTYCEDMSCTEVGQELDARCVLARDASGTCYFLLPQERKLLLVSQNQEVCHEQSLRAVRSMMRWLLIERGWLPFQSACCSKNGQAICLTGSGRVMQVLLNLLARSACDLVSNDRLLLYDKGNEVLVCGLPGSFDLRMETLRSFPQVLQWLESAPSTFFPRASATSIRQLVEERGSPAESAVSAESVPLLASELTALFGVAIEPLAQLKFFLRVDSSEQPEAMLHPLPEAHTGLLEQYPRLADQSESYMSHFFTVDDEMLQERLDSLLTRHAAHVPVYALHLNGHVDEASTALIVTALKEGGPPRES